jgi:hypothetical protein
MNIMKIPGFTAEASLYQISGQYHPANQLEHVSGTVHPAFGHLTPFSLARCLIYRCHWDDVSPGAPFPPKIVWRCGFEWIC